MLAGPENSDIMEEKIEPRIRFGARWLRFVPGSSRSCRERVDRPCPVPRPRNPNVNFLRVRIWDRIGFVWKKRRRDRTIGTPREATQPGCARKIDLKLLANNDLGENWVRLEILAARSRIEKFSARCNFVCLSLRSNCASRFVRTLGRWKSYWTSRRRWNNLGVGRFERLKAPDGPPPRQHPAPTRPRDLAHATPDFTPGVPRRRLDRGRLGFHGLWPGQAAGGLERGGGVLRDQRPPGPWPSTASSATTRPSKATGSGSTPARRSSKAGTPGRRSSRASPTRAP